MPKYLIEDSWSGIKIPVDGDSEPSEQDAADIVAEEISSLATNLMRFPGNKFILDVGPLRALKASIDNANESLEATRLSLEAMDKAREAADAEAEKASQEFDWSTGSLDTASIWSKKFHSTLSSLTNAPLSYKSSYRQTADAIPDNTLIIEAHGSESGGLYTDWEHDFSISNIAALIGQETNNISTIINRACYGGKCTPQQFETSFPNLSSIYQTEDSVPNTVGLNDVTRFFGGDARGTNWVKVAGEWAGGGVPPPTVFEPPHYWPEQ